MKYQTMLKTLFIILLFTGLTGAAFAQQTPSRPAPPKPNRPGMGMHFRGHHKKMPMLPNLTNDQKKQMKNIMLNTRKQVLPLQNQMREKRDHLRTLATADKTDMKAINQTIDKIGSLRTQITKDRVASVEKVRNLLTDDQRIIFDSRIGMFLSQHHEMENKMGMGFHGWHQSHNK